MLSSDFLFPRFFVVPLANPSNFSHCKCFSSRIKHIIGHRTKLIYLLFTLPYSGQERTGMTLSCGRTPSFGAQTPMVGSMTRSQTPMHDGELGGGGM